MFYYCEGWCIKGLVFMIINYIKSFYDNDLFLYWMGIVVGDYLVDYYYEKNLEVLEIDFFKVFFFNILVGSLVVQGVFNLLMADKVILVINIVNGFICLQLVILQVGQVVGLMVVMVV